ncbi:unnamed protein product [Heligmosomoides polygyrus]|uniref:C2H2-type domain-containing protein n=1 Tax=Heligmosomoides polygyrus TaxID=6339 RepID=A0A3P8F477_HELPZ|nr:unnamed protein product [Heligmosomoides polygyrus]
MVARLRFIRSRCALDVIRLRRPSVVDAIRRQSAWSIEDDGRNSSKTLKCPKCNWHYKYQETLEIHMKEKHSEGEVKCGYCAENRVHPKLARGESYSCGYKPYRCELCKYSTTTKGNLSIHMQSDKHLHAVQELPSSIASLSCPPARSPPSDGDHALVCVVCGCFSCDDLDEMIAHADKDRSRPSHGDISMSGGVFRCHLCPYHTNLKANFQLHTRTDKHLQRVQMVGEVQRERLVDERILS